MKKLIFSGILICGLLSVSHAQNCTQNLNEAEDDYEAGKLLIIPAKITQCLEFGGFSGEEEIRARKLLTLAYIFTDEEELAEQEMIGLLKADPEHRYDDSQDPSEFVYLYNQIQSKPVIRLIGKFGGNVNQINTLSEHSVRPDTMEFKSYEGKTDLYGEILVEKYLGHGFDVGTGVHFRRLKSSETDDVAGDDNLNVTMDKVVSSIRIPLYSTYTFWADNRDKNFLPYLIGGVTFDYVLAAKYLRGVSSRQGGTPFTISNDIDMLSSDMINKYNLSLYGGLGFKYRVKTHFLTFEVRYDNSRFNIINGSNRYVNQDISWDFGSIDNDYNVNPVSFSVGYRHSLYNVKRIIEK